MYHPDVVMGGLTEAEKDRIDESQKVKIEDKFKALTSAYDRLDKWIEERD